MGTGRPDSPAPCRAGGLIMTRSRTSALLVAVLSLTTLGAATAADARTPEGMPEVATAAPRTPVLRAVRAAHHPGFDRVVFEFSGPVPSSRSVAYVSTLVADGSGDRVPIAGRAILQVRFSPADAHTGSGTVTAPLRESYTLPNVVQVVRSGDFEAVTTYGIGLARKQHVTVHSLTRPSRVVVDIGTAFPTVERKVWMFNATNFEKGRRPYFTPVLRRLATTAPATGAMDRIFAGPTAAERAAGLRPLLSQATGFTGLSVTNRVARVRLTGGCDSGGSTATIAGAIMPTLNSFASVDAVKIYDPSGRTERPGGRVDSMPECLEP